MDFANSNNQSADLKENYSEAPKRKKKRKVQLLAGGGKVEPTEPASDGSAEATNVPEGLDAFINEQPKLNKNTQSDEMGANVKLNDAPAGLDEFIAPEVKEEKYGTPVEMAKTALEGVAEGTTFGLSTGIEQALGVKAEDIKSREEVNPYIKHGAKLASLLIPGAPEAEALSAAGKGAAEVFNLGKEGASILSKIGASTVKGATETALLQSGDEVSKMLRQEPGQSLQTAITEIGLAGALGAGLGAGLGSASQLWKSTVGTKAGQLIEDFKGRINEHLSGVPEPVQGIEKELTDYYSHIKDISKDIAVFPERIPGLTDNVTSIVERRAINKALEKLEPALNDFERKFTAEIAGEKVIDPGKVATYLKQIGKPNGEIKQRILDNFLKAADDYKDALHSAHLDASIESPIKPSSLNFTKQSLEELSPGAKLADLFIKKGLQDAAGKSLGATVGAGLGHLLGHSGIGALIGAHALGPFFNSVLPALAKPLLSLAANSEGLKAAAEYGAAVATGEKLASNAAKNLFKRGEDIIPKNYYPKPKEIEKLKEMVIAYQEKPELMTKLGGQLGHYFPEHGQNAAQTMSTALDYLNSLRPSAEKKMPLDSDIKPSKFEQREYENSLALAQQPLLILDQIKEGVVTPKAIQLVQKLYPDLYTSLCSKISEQIASNVDQAKLIPYKTRIGLSMFMAQPLDSTMTPESIMSAQMPAKPNPPSQAQQASGPPKSTSGLNKAPISVASPEQARMIHKQQKG